MSKDLSKIQYYNTILEAIGNTPLIKLNKITKGLKPHIFVKAEFLNPGGSVKDRIGVEIIEDAEKSGRLKPGGTIVESTSGNTGMGLALAAAVKGYKTVFTMPDKMSQEKISNLRAFGAEVIVTPTSVPHESPESYTEVAKKRVRETPNAILADQYENPKNPEAHYKTTGPEIWKQTGGQIDHFICGIGTGGTISGIGKFLKEKNPKIKIIGVDIKGSILQEYFYNKKFDPVFKTYKVEGIGQDYVPKTLDFSVVDEVLIADDQESFLTARKTTREEGIFIGGSAGTAIHAALEYCKHIESDDVVVILLPDSGSRYASKIYNDVWMRENGFLKPERITLKYILTYKSEEIPALVSVERNFTVRNALERIREYGISQLPVLENGKCFGTVTESKLLSEVLKDQTMFDKPVELTMDAPLPSVHMNEEIQSAVKYFTQKFQAVLVTDNEQPIGIITRFDVLDYMSQ
ncbi:MAG: cystathionine beta-synthase [Bacteroidetes bacterium]|nr:cystathionine beta-synthase [Bacteroidota bacterium]